MPKKTIDLLFRSKLLVAIIAAVLLVLGVVQVAQGLIDTRYYRDQVVQAIKAQTGREIVIRGSASISLLPVPTLYIQGVELRNMERREPTPGVTIEMLSITATPASLLSGDPQVAGVHLERPTLEVTRAQDNIIHWDWLNSELVQALAGSGASAVKIDISDGRILYRNERNDHELVIDQIQASGATGARPELGGTWMFYGHEMRFAIDTGAGDNRNIALNARFFTDDKNQLQLQGNLNLASDPLTVNGTVSLEVEDALAWMREKVVERQDTLFDKISRHTDQIVEEQRPLPVKFSGKWNQEGWNLKLTEVQLQGFNSVGAGKLEVTWADELAIATALDFSALDYNQWNLFGSRLLQHSRAIFGYAGGDRQHNPLPPDMQLSLDLKAEHITVGAQTWKNARISAQLDDAAITVNQFRIELPGESNLTLFGVISQGGTGYLRFEGSMETQGKSLRQALTVFDASAAELPETGFTDFYARANIFVSSDQVRLSEADVKISELGLNGGLVAYFDANPRMEADVRLRDINFDYFRDVWREKQKEEGKQDFSLKLDKSIKFSWLKKLRTTIDFKVSVDQFTFLERPGQSASFRLFAKEGQFGVYNIRFNYPTEIMEANLSLNVTEEQPFVTVLLTANEFNTDYFSLDEKEEKVISITPQSQALIESPPPEAKTVEDLPKPAAKTAKPAVASKPKWSEELIDMSWMEEVGAAFDISVGNLIHGDTTVRNLKLKATLENNLLTLQSLNFTCWQGRCDITGSVYGGKVPGVSVGFTLYDAELQDILKSAVARENITGRTSISGTLTTSGVNYLSWVSQAEAKLVMAARGVVVHGLNLQGVVDAVAVSRTAADVFNNVNLMLTKGSTEMSVDGNINVKNGVVRTPGITLKTGTITGNLTGEVKLVPWTMDLSTFLQFPAMTSETVPTMTVQLTGPIDAPELRTDTSSLEAYVVKRIIGR